MHGVLPLARFSGANAQDNVGVDFKKLRITLGSEQLRILDARLPGGVSGVIRDGEQKYSLLAGCELGVWRFNGDSGLASECTADLIFADNLIRQKYTIKGVTVKTDSVVNGEFVWSEPTYAETVEDAQIKNLIPFGCRAIKRLDKIFYLTSLGLFVFDELIQKWRTCSALIPEQADASAFVQPASAIYDISLVRVFDGHTIYLVAAQSGLYLMNLKDDFATTFTEV